MGSVKREESQYCSRLLDRGLVRHLYTSTKRMSTTVYSRPKTLSIRASMIPLFQFPCQMEFPLASSTKGGSIHTRGAILSVPLQWDIHLACHTCQLAWLERGCLASSALKGRICKPYQCPTSPMLTYEEKGGSFASEQGTP